MEFVTEADLQHGIERSLTANLENVLRHLEHERFTPACNNLGAFLNQVNAQDGKQIPEQDAESFRSAAIGIQDQLDC